MHRTTLALVAAGSVAATALVTAVLTGGEGPTRPEGAPPASSPSSSTSSTPTPSASPSRGTFTPARGHTWRPAVPDGFDLANGLPEPGGDFTRDATPVTEAFCDTQAFPVESVLDARRDGRAGPEFGDRRDLRVFPDDATAHRFLRRAEDLASACPEELQDGTRWIHTVSSGATGEESIRIVRTYETDGLTNAGATWWDLARVGNAVLLTATGGEHVPGENLRRGIRDHQASLTPIVGSMCVFSVEGCPESAPSIPANFPLAAGWPADSEAEPGRRYGLTGPNGTLPPLEFSYCREDVTVAGGTDSLRADWTNVEDYRGRALLTFATESEAIASLTEFVDSWTGCRRWAAGAGFTAVHGTRATDLGDESTALVRWTEYDGNPAVGLQVVHVVRVGSTLLVDAAANEGGGGPDRARAITDQVKRQGDALLAILDSMYHL